MKLQKNTELALCSVLDFAANPGRQLSVAEIATRYRVSSHHLAKVLRTLGRAGLVRAARGVGGGYQFSGNVKRVTLMDVIEPFEDIGAERGAGARAAGRPGRRRAEKAPAATPFEVEGALGVVMSEIDEITKATFRTITLDTMLKLIERRRGARG